ncbi:MAG: 2-hydroxyacid dehydrogenase [Oscillospiraceae bacterium]|nr:2-hydroxyacid dehydrogenase [Oscillospiraceae bacterium]
MKLAFFDTKPYDIPGFDRYAVPAGIEVKYFEPNLNIDTVSLAAGFDAVCVFVNDVVSAPVVQKLHALGVKAIVLRCAGFNNVDIKACQGKLRVFRVPAYSPHAVAEHAMALLLTVNRHTHKAHNRTREFNFSLQGLTGFDLYGKTVGIIGGGKIGRVFADICRGFGMKILVYDKFPDPKTGLTYAPLEKIYEEADILSLHCPLTEENRHMICQDSLRRMKDGVVIVNTSRGGLVNTEDLIQGIKSGKVGAACLDVYEEEGDLFYEDFSGHIVQDDKLVRLIAMPNVIVTSHQAFLTNEALDNIASTTVSNLVRFFAGDPDESTEVVYGKN